jgi:prephenate dehydrogenase
VRLFNKVAIIGTGLVGGSLGLELRRRRLAGCVVGVCRHSSSLLKAKKMGAIDEGTLDTKEAVKDADLVVLATPVSEFLILARSIAPVLKKEAIITDVGSTKKSTVSSLEKIFGRRNHFVGAHPLAGSEKKGIAEAHGGLFDNAVCVITRTKNTDAFALKKILRLWKELGSRTAVMEPVRHDRILAAVSHLPHIVANALILSIDSKCLPFGAGGLRDTTRIASSDPWIWRDIFLTNRKEILLAVNRFRTQLNNLSRVIKSGDGKLLFSLLDKAKNKRDLL